MYTQELKFPRLSLLLSLYAFTVGWTTLGNVTGVTPIPLIVSLLLVAVLTLHLIQGGKLRIKFTIEDSLLLIFLVSTLIGTSISAVSDKINTNHFFAYLTVIFIYYFGARVAYINQQRIEVIMLWALRGAQLVAMIGILEFCLALFLDIYISDYLNYGVRPESVGYYFGIYRPRSVTEEPTNFAFFLNAMFPLLLGWFWGQMSRTFRVSNIILYLVSLLMSFSAAGWASILGALAILFIREATLGLIAGKRLHLFYIKLAMLVPLLIVIGSYFSDLYFLYGKLFSYLSGEGPRASNLITGISLFVEQADSPIKTILGRGAGWLSHHGYPGLNSWYLRLLVEQGLFGLLVIIIFILLLLRRVWLLPNSSASIGMALSLYSMMIHFNAVSDFYMAVFWFVIATLVSLSSMPFSGLKNMRVYASSRNQAVKIANLKQELRSN